MHPINLSVFLKSGSIEEPHSNNYEKNNSSVEQPCCFQKNKKSQMQVSKALII